MAQTSAKRTKATAARPSVLAKKSTLRSTSSLAVRGLRPGLGGLVAPSLFRRRGHAGRTLPARPSVDIGEDSNLEQTGRAGNQGSALHTDSAGEPRHVTHHT